jgi:uncharacterized membrane protein
MTNKEIMEFARSKLKGNWGTPILICFIYFVITCGLSSIPFIGTIANLVIAGPLLVGLYMFFLALIRDEEIELGQLFKGFSSFGNSFLAYLLVCIFTLLWLLLLIVPGIIAALSYSMTFFIIVDDPNIDGLKAIRKSKQLMMGNKWILFCLFWRFFWWCLLGILSLGIGFLWIGPYMATSVAKFYETINKTEESIEEPVEIKKEVEEQVKDVGE